MRCAPCVSLPKSECMPISGCRATSESRHPGTSDLLASVIEDSFVILGVAHAYDRSLKIRLISSSPLKQSIQVVVPEGIRENKIPGTRAHYSRCIFAYADGSVSLHYTAKS